MTEDWKTNQEQLAEALQTIENINTERQIKGNSAVSAGRYGQLVANMVKYAETKFALELLNSQVTGQTDQEKK